MMSEEDPTPEEVRASIVPKSDQLNADDLLTGPITVTITKVRRGNREQPIIIEIEGHRPYKPCKTMLRVIVAILTEHAKTWVGHQMTLYCDPDVLYAGVRVGGIRISHMSGMMKPKTLIITERRGKRIEVTIHPLQTSDADRVYIDDARQEIDGAESLEILKAIGHILATKSKTVQDALRPLYAQRKKELEL